MNVKEVRQEAKKRLNGICRVCHECNGVVCADVGEKGSAALRQGG